MSTSRPGWSDSALGTPIRDEVELRELVEHPHPVMRDKGIAAVDEQSRRFLEAATFYLLATTAADGSVDVSPRGDPAGSVLVLDERTIAFPDRPGNRRADSLRNLLQHPRAGMVFIVPGRHDVLRVNGRATPVRDAPFAHRFGDPAPPVAVVLEVEELFVHCGQALRRSSAWDPGGWPAEDALPNVAELFESQQTWLRARA
ncbi:MSMEG_1061 family FMN-dependent PPOX-type flavoprotein [Saccharothrix yanglingensis]|uniref:Pyridoxamine 5'-phosphate oxidase n=1 Tax=Saccharothrix yanglingensis TaxID=659496 RepID=A0ABU0WX57_9PSEU|nr:MSMEG_1061 family FMN-dependent PPOX-type flavoprotein [Saccharothrix yanglingensis]MDQ2583967.1 pyridoxamine 5'-phosphate oxidase [Saccharothrix yanglingensis]